MSREGSPSGREQHPTTATPDNSALATETASWVDTAAVAERSMHVTDIFRYSKGASNVDIEIDLHPNYHHFTATPGHPRLLLESGINPAAQIDGPDGRRRPVISLRSSPRTAGHESNPWHDEFDLGHGHVRYYGDHKATTVGLPGATPGNKALLHEWRRHAGTTADERQLAAPLLIYRSAAVQVGKRRVHQGYVEFAGLGVIERLEYVVQRDGRTSRSFPNLLLDIAVLALPNDLLDMRFIDDRRDSTLSAKAALRHAPPSWLRWVRDGRVALPQVRRRVLSSRVLTAAQQLPDASDDRQILEKLYAFFDGRKHAFELLASYVAASVLGDSGGRYRAGWITRAGGDGGMDFVGRLDVGTPDNNTPLIVLGQAKCIRPTTSISPDEVARLVARLRRGWVGVFVTTGAFSKQAQVEIIDDQYPVVLVAGQALVTHVQRIAAAQSDGDVDGLLQQVADEYDSNVLYRRPEEVLGA